MARVFLSHASQDRECTRQLNSCLVAAGHEVFWDQDPGNGVTVGEEWDKRLHERLRWADAVVCVVTSAAVASTWCTAEVSIALSRGSRVFPVRAEPGVDHPLLPSVQYADVTIDSPAGCAALVEALHRVDVAGGLGWPDNRSPFPGLRALDVDEHRVFFGRHGELEQLTRLVRSPAERAEQAVLLVVGPSGCGKSSLVRAGLLHVMADEPGWWTLAPVLPGADPVAALARELAAAAPEKLGWTVTQVRHLLDDTGLTGLADELLLAAPGGRRRRLLVVIDQFEELLTQTPPGHRAHFAQLLRSALSGPVQVVATLRPEFLDQLLLDADLAVLPTHPYALQPLHREALRTVIEDPARLAGIDLDKDLVARLVTDTVGGTALPLLAFTLAQLADGVGRGGRLSQQRYDQLGGVQGALTRQADTALAEASAATGRGREQVIAGLMRLVTVDEQGRPTRWRVSRTGLPDSVIRELDVFVARRLVTTDTYNGDTVMEVAHEAFLSAWAPLAHSIKENVSALRARRAVEQAAAKWDNDGHRSVRLWERGQLAAAVADTGTRLQGGELVTDRVDLSSTACDFLRASIRRDRFRRGRAIIVLSVLLVFAVVAATIAFIQQGAAEQQRNVAVTRQVAAQAMGLYATNPALAAQLSLAAYRFVPTPEARSSLLRSLAQPYGTQLIGHTDFVDAVAFNRDGHVLATGSKDKTVRLWDVSDQRSPHLLDTLASSSRVVSVVFSPDSHTLVTSDGGRLWDVSDPRHSVPLATLTPDYFSFSAAFSPDGHILVTGCGDNTARLWDVSDPHHPSLLGSLSGPSSSLSPVAFSPDGRTLATGSSDNTARLWDVSDPHHPGLLGSLTGPSGSVVFSPDGRVLASSDSNGSTARLWDVSDPHHPSLMRSLTGPTGPLAFSPDGRTLATGSSDHTVQLWDVSDPRDPHSFKIFTGHTYGISSVAFSSDGRILATGGAADNTARLWDVSGTSAISGTSTVAGHTGSVFSVAFSPDRHTVATSSVDGTARLWDISDPHHPGPLGAVPPTGRTTFLLSVAFSPDGYILATGSHYGTGWLWDVRDPHHPRLLSTVPTGGSTGLRPGLLPMAFSPDGHILATADYKDGGRLWDISDPHHPSLLSTITSATSVGNSAAFSPDGRTLATGSFGEAGQLWNVSEPRHPNFLSILSGQPNGVNNGVYSVAFSPDRRTLATGGFDSTARLWDVSDPGHPSLLGTLSGHMNVISSVTFSPDGHTLATGSWDSTVRLWDVGDTRHPSPLTALTSVIDYPGNANASSIDFSPDGGTLATSVDGAARLWEINIESIAARICRSTPTITEDEWGQYFSNLRYQPPCP